MMAQFIGKFHLLLVHLPIGFLVLAMIFKVMVNFGQRKEFEMTVSVILKMTFALSILTCITGYLLSQSGDYELSLVSRHQWTAIALTAVTGLLCLKSLSLRANNILWIVVSILLLVVGHLGGSLTHGENYLFGSNEAVPEKKFISNINEAMVYSDVIVPILEKKCYSCHSSKKQKGQLRLDTKDFILKGGENGACIVAGKAYESLVYKNIMLPEGDDYHMPPKGRPQLTSAEKKLITWWIDSGAGFETKVREYVQGEDIKKILLSLQSGTKNVDNPLTLSPIVKADATATDKLKKLGAVVLPVAQNSNYLSVNISGIKALKSKDLELLLPLKNHIIWLKAGDLNIGDSLLTIASQLPNLRTLHLNKTNITDDRLPDISTLKNLKSLNLTNTDISEKGLLGLKTITTLEKIYLYESKVNKSNWEALKRSFPNTSLDSGNYFVPIFHSDTVEVKEVK